MLDDYQTFGKKTSSATGRTEPTEQEALSARRAEALEFARVRARSDCDWEFIFDFLNSDLTSHPDSLSDLLAELESLRTHDASSVSDWGFALRERDEARAEVALLRAGLTTDCDNFIGVTCFECGGPIGHLGVIATDDDLIQRGVLMREINDLEGRLGYNAHSALQDARSVIRTLERSASTITRASLDALINKRFSDDPSSRRNDHIAGATMLRDALFAKEGG
jgi:hypothetical protein